MCIVPSCTGAVAARSFVGRTPICSNTLSSLTKRALSDLGFDTAVYRAHSTRGPFLTFLKGLGLTSEVVADLGQWENLVALTRHYLRVGGPPQAATANNQSVVHTTSFCKDCRSFRRFP